MKRAGLAAAALIVAASATATVYGKPPFQRGGSPSASGGGGGELVLCGTGSVCARSQSGQTFLTWSDVATGTPGAAYRYRVYRSTSPIDATNYSSAFEVGRYILNNSGQYIGGNYSLAGRNLDPITQSFRQDISNPMAALTDLGTQLPYGTGLQVYTATGSGDAYYAVVYTDTSNANPEFMGSVGPVAETVGTPTPIKQADSLSREIPNGAITIGTPLPLVYEAHHAAPFSGCSVWGCQSGDVWSLWLTPAEGWQDGRPMGFGVWQDSGPDYARHNPSLPVSLAMMDRDTIWPSDGVSAGLQMYHIGMGMSPLHDTANRYYLTGCRQVARALNFALDHYNIDPNQVHWRGYSMGGWGGGTCGMRGLPFVGGPQLAAMWIAFPIWRQDRRGSPSWPGATWTASEPFKATLAAPSATLGAVATSVMMRDSGVDTQWGGDGGWADVPAFIAANPATDLPPTFWCMNRYDQYPGGGVYSVGFKEQIEAAAAFQAAHRGFAFVWASQGHDTLYPCAAIDYDQTGSPDAASYKKTDFRLDRAYLAFANSSIDDDPGTSTVTASGLLDGDYFGCMGCGFNWSITTDTSSAFHATVGNSWMTRSQTTIPTTTLTADITSTATSMTVADASGFLSRTVNPYALIGNEASPSTQEMVKITNIVGNTVTISTRHLFGTTAKAHAAGVTVQHLPVQPTGPNGGPVSSMTVDIALRRMQGGLSPTDCAVTPDGDSTVHFTIGSGLAIDGVPVLTGVTIKDSGPTDISCS